MSDAREVVMGWADAGVLPRERVAEALRIARVMPDAAQWQSFAERLCAWLGAVLLAAATGYFIAANWQALGRYAKFGMIEAGIVVALVGQVYQTGADTVELFAAWALLILPWVIVSREPALWLLWIALVDVAIVLYFRVSVARGIDALDLLFTSRKALWWMLAFNAAGLLAWEAAAAARGGWLAARWAPRALGVAVGIVATALAVEHIAGFRSGSVEALAVYAAFAAAFYWAYRVRARDVFMLAGLVLSGTVVIAFAFARHLMHETAGGFLLTGLVVIACAAAGSVWLRRVGAEP